MKNFSMLLPEAIEFAADVHRGQHDKGYKPYILHPIRVMLRCKSEAAQIVGVLHDVFEDVPHAAKTDKWHRLEAKLPAQVVEALFAMTKLKEESYDEYIRRLSQNAIAREVKLADAQDNSDPARLAKLHPEQAAHFREKYERVIQILTENDRF